MISIDTNVTDIEKKLNKRFKNKIATIDELLIFSTENNCSDLYIKAGTKPHINRYGRMYEVPCMQINNNSWNDFANIAISSENHAKYVRDKMLDFAYSIEIPDPSLEIGSQHYRYRVSAGFSQRRSIASFRMITSDLPTFSAINFPKNVEEILRSSFKSKTGIILICGPTGSGKTTTLASSINEYVEDGKPLNNSAIYTLEDPIEYIYKSKSRSRITQKELGIDFRSYTSGIKQVLRERPTHIVCGEIRDREGIIVCVEAARTGHKVISTFHTDDVAGTVSRMYFYLSDGNNTNEVMFNLITHLDFILCQRLIPVEDGFKLETQYVLFIDPIKKALQKVVASGGSIPIAIDKLFKNQELVNNGIVKDWT